MRALVISGGGSKGAFAGGMAQYLIQTAGREYDIFIGTSTGSLLLAHLALQDYDTIYEAYTSVDQKSIFNINPFTIQKRKGHTQIGIHHWNVLRSFLRKSKTFGESKNLRDLYASQLTEETFQQLKSSNKDIVVTVANITNNKLEYKSLRNCEYQDFVDWVWISCNFIPFMSLVVKNKFEYADGGLGCIVPITEAIRRGATVIDAIVLDTEVPHYNRLHARNPFDNMGHIFDFMGDRIKDQNIQVAKLRAKEENVALNMFYTPRVLTTNSLIFDAHQMRNWWMRGWIHAKNSLED
ncbi:MAG: patatin-like phospholipase family protein [Flavobacteriaceae bacterium]